ncbi:MAG: sulfatase-like hydrolase/transferase [Planctomycetes bacterium]|nr:sulfatase-like hydrolase/transferase [Planctomycetota bacterium]MCH9727935.1 sulfatase-like hydrolase/transferase [Planctomycetota bacterium]MCH9778370.1 sulfatase-like hydrolase/transferase [Planctomycetota bacterium]MCH9790325.1 sulfatase-like hydrolase/transferase [Planctomycetota bacterium]MDF1742889.1 sulfatase-like hydrolase/transferase [Gimesia sp.]
MIYQFRIVVFVLACSLGLSCFTSSLRAEQTQPSRPNIILCMTDDQGWGETGFNGHPILKTPHLDDMAASGLRLDRFYAAAPVCSPTRGSFLTGRHPNRFACFSWGHTLRPQEVTVAEAVKSAGYTTGHFGKWHLGSVQANSPVSPGNSGFDEWVSSPNFYENNPFMSHNGVVTQLKGESSRVTVDAALKFIKQADKKKKPFLAVIWFGNPHTPHEAVSELKALYKDQDPSFQNYFGEITGVDRAMGHLRQQLRDLGLAENTLLWFTSDNGPRPPRFKTEAARAQATGGLAGWKGNLWEGGIRVPSMIEWPARIKKPETSSVPCGTIDIYPTVLQIVGAKVSHQPHLDGVSLLPLIDGQMTKRSRPMGFWTYPMKGHPKRSTDILLALQKRQTPEKPNPAGPIPDAKAASLETEYSKHELPGAAAWIDGDYKLLKMVSKKNQEEYKLYHLGHDRSEKNDLSGDDPGRLQKMKSGLLDWQKSVVDSLNGKDYAD